MKGKEKIKIFCSYCHKDKEVRKKLDKYIVLLKKSNIIQSWNDTKIPSGDKLENQINQHLIDADIVLSLLSDDFLSSKNCKEELRKAKAERKKIIPIIMSPCQWKKFTFQDGDKLGDLKAIPEDGKPIYQWENPNKAWTNVYEELKRVCEAEYFIQKLKLNDKFKNDLDDCGPLKFFYPRNNSLTLSDIFVWPKFKKAKELDNPELVSEKNLFKDIDKSDRIWIIGEDQSGKTTLAKNIFLELRKKSLIPVFFPHTYKGLFSKQLKNKLSEQYADPIDVSNYKDNIILIFDDFHKYNKQDKLLANLKDSGFKHILLTDKIFSFNLPDKNSIDLKESYCRYEIIESYATKRDELIRKWLAIDGNEEKNDNYKSIDEYAENIKSTLGKVFDGGIVPSYPFFILSIISTRESGPSIASQEHCYHALIYQHFVKHDLGKDFEAYLNFLCELAYFLWKKGKQEINEQDLKKFIEKDYTKRYITLLQADGLIRKLETIDILTKDGLGYYSFHYKYFFYYFVARHITDKLQNNIEEIKKIFDYLHKNENAYIAIFICHHFKDRKILDYIELNANTLFKNYSPATLNKDEVAFIDERVREIVRKITLPAVNQSEWERRKALQKQDMREESYSNETQTSQDEDTHNDLLLELRRSVRTAEVMGHIIKNRWGSLPKDRIKSIFQNAMNIYLRILSSFLASLQDKEQFLEEYIVEKLQEQFKKQKHDLSKAEATKIAKKIVTALTLSFSFQFMEKTISSLGINKSPDTIEEICNEINTPASLLVKRGIFMQYFKRVDPDEIYKESENFSDTAITIRNFMIAHHCRFHNIDFREKQKIEQKLGIPIAPNPYNK